MQRLIQVVLLLLGCNACAHASSFDVFHLSGHGTDLTFTLPDEPLPTSIDPGYEFGLENISFVNHGVTTTGAHVYFDTPPISGGFSLTDSADRFIENFEFAGPQLFTGSTAAPTFRQGSFDLKTLFCSSGSSDGHCIQDAYSLTIAPAAVTPEPNSVILLGTGLLGMAAAAKRRLKAIN